MTGQESDGGNLRLVARPPGSLLEVKFGATTFVVRPATVPFYEEARAAVLAKFPNGDDKPMDRERIYLGKMVHSVTGLQVDAPDGTSLLLSSLAGECPACPHFPAPCGFCHGSGTLADFLLSCIPKRVLDVLMERAGQAIERENLRLGNSNPS